MGLCRGHDCCVPILAGFVVVLGATAVVFMLRGITSGSYHPLDEAKKRDMLASELQALSLLANETVEQFGEHFQAQMRTIERDFCTNGSDSVGLCDDKCKSQNIQRILLVFPIRDRWALLKTLLKTLLPLMQSSNACIFMVVVEQTNALAFNKGLLMNAAALEMKKYVPFNCIIFHDVDLVPLPGSNVKFTCPNYPHHLSVKVDKFKYRLPYIGLVGGVFAIPLQRFLQVNGYSNMFWGWGAEDDDLHERLAILGIPVTRPMPDSPRYTMLRHQSSKSLDPWRKTVLLKMTLKRYRLDGLNSAYYSLVKWNISSTKDLLGDRELFSGHQTKNFMHLVIDPKPIPGQNVDIFYNVQLNNTLPLK